MKHYEELLAYTNMTSANLLAAADSENPEWLTRIPGFGMDAVVLAEWNLAMHGLAPDFNNQAAMDGFGDAISRSVTWMADKITSVSVQLGGVFGKGRKIIGTVTGYSVESDSFAGQPARVWTPPVFLQWIRANSLYVSATTQALYAGAISRMAKSTSQSLAKELLNIGSQDTRLSNFAVSQVNQIVQKTRMSEAQLRQTMSAEMAKLSRDDKIRLVMRIREFHKNDASVDHELVTRLMKEIATEQMEATAGGIDWLQQLFGMIKDLLRTIGSSVVKILTLGMINAARMLGLVFQTIASIISLVISLLKAISGSWYAMFGIKVVSEQELELVASSYLPTQGIMPEIVDPTVATAAT